jgi:2-succinyl-6-hydroxy-2,4-cyclohexadiene-1-carboxylate synthase
MGGRLALYLALRYPDLWQNVIIESASPGLRTEEERQERLGTDRRRAADLLRMQFSEFIDAWYSQPLFNNIYKTAAYLNLREQRLENDPEQLARALTGMSIAVQPDLWPELAELQIPSLFLAGEHDEKYKTIMYKAADISPRILAHVVPGCGHNIHLEKPMEFVKIIKNFLTL